jgi:hypothetical protein
VRGKFVTEEEEIREGKGEGKGKGRKGNESRGKPLTRGK